MSVSGFHHHVKSVTAMSPLRFQKHLRLQEARRLMMGEDLDAQVPGFASAMKTRLISAVTTKGCSVPNPT
jgi:AraC-like DNA-binding protein